MTKKTTKITGTKKVNLIASEVTATPRIQIDLLPADLGREDLNKIAHKINEIINHLNA